MTISRATSLYRFLWYCNQVKLPKLVLDCGAGGKLPPLYVFHQEGYRTHGIDISPEGIALANAFEEAHGMELNIKEGDMRRLLFSNSFFSFLYSYNSIFHLNKEDTERAVEEFKRVTCKQGLIYVNFLSVEDFLYGQGEDVGNGSYLQDEGDDMVIHTFYEDDEPDELFEPCTILYKEKRIVDRMFGDEKVRQVFLEYIVRV